MNKLTTATIGIAIFFSTLLTGTSAFAAPTTCAEIGRTVHAGEKEYLPSLDTDSDGLICESKVITLTPIPGTPAPVPPSSTTPAAGQVDSNGNPVQYDSNGKPIKTDKDGNPIKTDEAGNPVQQDNLANTGADAGLVIWALIGGLALAIGLFFLRRAKTQ
jgi:LPXTG-motif cell wall-anchored protein